MNSAQDITVKCNAKKIKFIQNYFNKADNYSLMMLLSIIGQSHNKYIPIDYDDGTGEEHTFSIRTIYSRFPSEMDSNIGLICMLENSEKDYSYVVNKLAFASTESENKKYQELYNVQLFIGYLLGGAEILYNKITLFGNDETNIFEGVYEMIVDDDEELISYSKLLIKEEEEKYGKAIT